MSTSSRRGAPTILPSRFPRHFYCRHARTRNAPSRKRLKTKFLAEQSHQHLKLSIFAIHSYTYKPSSHYPPPQNANLSYTKRLYPLPLKLPVPFLLSYHFLASSTHSTKLAMSTNLIKSITLKASVWKTLCSGGK